MIATSAKCHFPPPYSIFKKSIFNFLRRRDKSRDKSDAKFLENQIMISLEKKNLSNNYIYARQKKSMENPLKSQESPEKKEPEGYPSVKDSILTKGNDAKDTNQSSILKLADLLEEKKDQKKQKILDFSEEINNNNNNNELLNIIEESIHEEIVKETEEQEKSRNFLPSIQNISAISHTQKQKKSKEKKNEIYELNRKENLVQNELKLLNREKKDYVKKIEKKNQIKMLMVRSEDIVKRNYQNLYEEPYKIEVIAEEDLENSLDNINYILNKKAKAPKKISEGPHLYIFPHVATSQTFKPIGQKTNFVINQSIVTQSNNANLSGFVNVNLSGITNNNGFNNQIGNNQIVYNESPITVVSNQFDSGNNRVLKSGISNIVDISINRENITGNITPQNKKNTGSDNNSNDNFAKNDLLNISKMSAQMNNSKFSKIESNNPNTTNMTQFSRPNSEVHKNDILMNKLSCEIIEEEKSVPEENSIAETKKITKAKNNDEFQKNYNEIGSYRKNMKERVSSEHRRVQMQIEMHKKKKKKRNNFSPQQDTTTVRQEEESGGTMHIVNRENFKKVLIS